MTARATPPAPRPETAAAAKKAKECGAYVVTISLKEECPLSEHSDFHFVQDPALVSLGGQGLAVRLGFEILHAFDGYGLYQAATDGFEKLDAVTEKARADAEKKAEIWAGDHKDDFICYTMGSGANFNVAYTTSICHLMEMEWVHSNSIHSGEFFHGPFEITDEHVPFLVYVSGGRTRVLDERALRFLNKYCKEVEIIERDGKHYLRINDYQGLRRLYGELLAEIQRITSEGDYAAAKEMVEKYAVKVNQDLHKEILERYKKLNLAPYKGFVNPVYTAVRDEAGNITDVQIDFTEGYIEQHLRCSRDYSPLPDVN